MSDRSVEMDDLFGEDEDTGLQLPSSPFEQPQLASRLAEEDVSPDPYANRRLDELRLTSAFRKIAWSSRGCIAAITADNKGLTTQCLRRSSSHVILSLSPALEIPSVREIHAGVDLAYLSWSIFGYELIVADVLGRITILRFPFTLDSISPEIQRSATDDLGSDLDVILNTFWLTRSARIPVRYQRESPGHGSLKPLVEHVSTQGPFQIPHIPAFVSITRAGEVRIDYRYQGVWKRRSMNLLPNEGPLPNIISHASSCSGSASIQRNDQSMLVAIYGSTHAVHLYRLQIQWRPSGRDLDVGFTADLLRSLPFTGPCLSIQLLPSLPSPAEDEHSDLGPAIASPTLLILHNLGTDNSPPWGYVTNGGWRLSGWVLKSPPPVLISKWEQWLGIELPVPSEEKKSLEWQRIADLQLSNAETQPIHLLVELLQISSQKAGHAIDRPLPLFAFLRYSSTLDRSRQYPRPRGAWPRAAYYASISPNHCLTSELDPTGNVDLKTFLWEFPEAYSPDGNDYSWVLGHFVAAAWSPWNADDVDHIAHATLRRDTDSMVEFTYALLRALEFDTKRAELNESQLREKFHTEFLGPFREGSIDKSPRLRRFLGWMLEHAGSIVLENQTSIMLILNTHCSFLLRTVASLQTTEMIVQILHSLGPIVRYYGQFAAFLMLFLRELERGRSAGPEPHTIEQLDDLQTKMRVPALSLILHPISLYHLVYLYTRLARLPEELQKLKSHRPAHLNHLFQARDEAADALLEHYKQMPVSPTTMRLFLATCMKVIGTCFSQIPPPLLKEAEERLMVEGKLSEVHLATAQRVLEGIVPVMFVKDGTVPGPNSKGVSWAALRYTDMTELGFVRMKAAGERLPEFSIVTRELLPEKEAIAAGKAGVWRCVRCGAKQEDVLIRQRVAWQSQVLQNCICGSPWEDVGRKEMIDRSRGLF